MAFSREREFLIINKKYGNDESQKCKWNESRKTTLAYNYNEKVSPITF